ncbi:ABC transporter permease [bacterium]|nr:ABC transporter permease [bacterium]
MASVISDSRMKKAQPFSWRRLAHERRELPLPMANAMARIFWAVVSVGSFALIWELLWFWGVTDPKLLPPPHVFLGNMADQAVNFNTAQRWQIGADPGAGPTPWEAVLITVAASAGRVFIGISIASVLALSLGIAIRYYIGIQRLVLPTVTLLSPVSPIAWLPVAIFLFGIGNAPAIFMVVIALFFHMTIATITHIDNVNPNYIHVARTMGASKWQIYRRVVIPAILPGVFVILRLNLFAAWMVVLIAESTGVGYGLGQVIMLARNTFNPSLVFFCIALIGLLGFMTDWLMRVVQQRVLYWINDPQGVLRAI